MLSANGDAVWVFSLKGQLGPLWPPPVPQSLAGPTGPVADGVEHDQHRRQQRRVFLWAGPHPGQGRDRGDLHQCRRCPAHGDSVSKRATGTPAYWRRVESKTLTFSEPGNYYYICAPHPWMYGQVIVE